MILQIKMTLRASWIGVGHYSERRKDTDAKGKRMLKNKVEISQEAGPGSKVPLISSRGSVALQYPDFNLLATILCLWRASFPSLGRDWYFLKAN